MIQKIKDMHIKKRDIIIMSILLLVISLDLFYTYTTLQERHFVQRGVPMRF